MIRMTKSFEIWCLKYHREIFHLLMFGHIEELTNEIYLEYLRWCETDEGRKYLKGQREEI